MFNSKEYNKKYYLRNKERLDKKSREWAAKNVFKKSIIAKRFYRKNKKKIIAKNKLYNQKNPIYKRVRVKNKFFYEHRLVMEKYLGRVLRSDEFVHHKDYNRQNNKIENLEVLSRAEHHLKHCKGCKIH